MAGGGSSEVVELRERLQECDANWRTAWEELVERVAALEREAARREKEQAAGKASRKAEAPAAAVRLSSPTSA